MKMLPLLISVLMYSTLSGCATVGGMKSAPISEGETAIAEAPLPQTLIIAKDVLPECNLDLEDEVSHNSNWIIVADSGIGLNKWGERVRVVGEAKNDEQTIIRVYARRKWIMDSGADPFKYQQCILQAIQLKSLKVKNANNPVKN